MFTRISNRCEREEEAPLYLLVDMITYWNFDYDENYEHIQKNTSFNEHNKYSILAMNKYRYLPTYNKKITEHSFNEMDNARYKSFEQLPKNRSPQTEMPTSEIIDADDVVHDFEQTAEKFSKTILEISTWLKKPRRLQNFD